MPMHSAAMGVELVLQFISVGNSGASWSETGERRWGVGGGSAGGGEGLWWAVNGGGRRSRRGAELVMSHDAVISELEAQQWNI